MISLDIDEIDAILDRVLRIMNDSDADSIEDDERHCTNDIDRMNETDCTYEINHQQIELMISSIATMILLASMLPPMILKILIASIVSILLTMILDDLLSIAMIMTASHR